MEFLVKGGFKVVGDTDSLPDLETKAHKRNPGIIMLDIGLLRGQSTEFLEKLKRLLPEVKLVLTGTEPQEDYAKHIKRMGGDLYLSEGLGPHQWMKKLKAIATGKKHKNCDLTSARMRAQK
jgi:DNA-binding NarL/FixJ family response regulator